MDTEHSQQETMRFIDTVFYFHFIFCFPFSFLICLCSSFVLNQNTHRIERIKTMNTSVHLKGSHLVNQTSLNTFIFYWQFDSNKTPLATTLKWQKKTITAKNRAFFQILINFNRKIQKKQKNEKKTFNFLTFDLEKSMFSTFPLIVCCIVLLAEKASGTKMKPRSYFIWAYYVPCKDKLESHQSSEH